MPALRTVRTVALVSLLLAGTAACRGKADGKAQLPPPTGPGAPPPPVPRAGSGAPAGAAAPLTASAGRTTGTLYAREEAQLAPSASGIIAEVLVEEGDRVRKGDVVFRLDGRDAQLRRDQAAAGVEAARASATATKVDLERGRALLAENAIPTAQWDQLVARSDAAAAGLKQAQALLAMAEKASADTMIRSPLNGVVTARLKHTGEMATMMPPTVVLVVQDQETLELRLRMPDRALLTVKAGTALTVRFTSLDLTRTATVVRVNPTVDLHTRTVEIVAAIANPDLLLRPGLLAEVELAGARTAPPLLPAERPAAAGGAP